MTYDIYIYIYNFKISHEPSQENYSDGVLKSLNHVCLISIMAKFQLD